MTQTTENPLTWERFLSGKTWTGYLDGGVRNRDLFERNYRDLEFSPEQEQRLRALATRPGGPHHLAVIGEDWCPDVYRGVGVAQRMAEVMGIECRIFERDKNKDLIQPYLLNGEFEAIPVFVFYNKDHVEIAHFVERPALAYHELRTTTIPPHPAYLKLDVLARERGHELSEEEIKAARAEAKEKFIAWQSGPKWAGWRVATVDECLASLEAALTGSATTAAGEPARS
jgi:hypothetical protein